MGSPANISLGAGELFVAPLGTTEPIDAATALPVAWRSIGYTEDGSTFAYAVASSPVLVEEELEAVRHVTTGRSGSVAFAMAEATAQNLALAINNGAGAAPTTVEPVAAGSELRVMLVHNAVSGARWVFRQCFQTGSLSVANKKAPAKKLLAVTFSLEKPATAQTFKVYPSAAGLI